MIGFLSRNNWGISSKREVDTRVRHQVGLELSQIHIQSTIESKGGSDGRYNLPNKTVEICVSGSLNIQIPSANVVDGFVVDHEGTVGVLKSGVSGQNGVVGLNNCS